MCCEKFKWNWKPSTRPSQGEGVCVGVFEYSVVQYELHASTLVLFE